MVGVLGALAMGFSTDLAEIVHSMVRSKSERALLDWKMIAIALSALAAIVTGAYGVLLNTLGAGKGTIALIVAVVGAGIGIVKLGINGQEFQTDRIATAVYLLAVGVWVFWAPLLFRAFRRSPAAFAYFAHIGVLTIVALAIGGLVQWGVHSLIWPAGTGASAFVITPMGGVTTASVWGVGMLYWYAMGAFEGFARGDKIRWTAAWGAAGLALCFGYGAILLAARDWGAEISYVEFGAVTLVLLGAMLAASLVAALVAGGLPMSRLIPLTIVVAGCAGLSIEWAARSLTMVVPGLRGPGDPAVLATAWWWTQAITILGSMFAVWSGVIAINRIARAIGRGTFR